MTVLNKRISGVPQGAVYIGRPSKWGNPFEITKQQSRDDVVRLYRDWLLGQPDLIESARRELRGKDLVCWCAPLACHGDVLNEVSNLEQHNMATHSEDFLTPVMRLVQGSPLEPQTKDLQTGLPLTVKTGPNAGTPTQKYFVAVAGKKGDPAVEALKAQFERVARQAFPQFFPNGGPCTLPNFSWKIVDGDGFDDKGQPNSAKPGFAGHWVFRFASSYAPRAFVTGKYAPHEQIADPKVFPRGHYVRVSGTVTDNIPSNKPGLYANLGMIEWSSIGDVIVSGPDASAVFGGGAAAPTPYTPVGVPAYAAPGALIPVAGALYSIEQCRACVPPWTDDQIVSAGYAMRPAAPAPAAPAPAAPAAPAPAAPAPAAPAPAPAPAPQGVAPHPGILAGAPLVHAGSAPAPAAPAPIAAAAAGFKMTNPAGPTYAAYMEQGWTDAALIQNNIMVPA